MPSLDDADRQAIARCAAIGRFQGAGADLIEVSVREPAGLVSAMRRFQSAVDAMLAELEPSTRAQVEPAAAAVRMDVPGLELRQPEDLAVEFNDLADSSAPLWSRALRALAVACPSAVPPDTIDQAEELRLGMELLPGTDLSPVFP